MAPSDYQSSINRCMRNAHRAPSDEIRQSWLSLAETYATLLILDETEICGPLISGKRQNTPLRNGDRRITAAAS